MSTPTKDQYKRAAEKNGWKYEPAYSGWVNDDERTHDGGYIVQPDAEDACWFSEIDVEGATP